MSPIRSVFFGQLSVTMEITQGDLRDKCNTFGYVCSIKLCPRMANVKLFSKNTRVKKELECVFSLSQNKSSESAKPGGPEPETTRSRQGVTEEESKHASLKRHKDEIRNVGPKPAPGIRCSNEESAQQLQRCCCRRVCVFCFLWLSWIPFNTQMDLPTVIHMQRLMLDHLPTGF